MYSMSTLPSYNFSPRVLSTNWFAIKFRSNLLDSWHDQVLVILKAGLLFREDSNAVEDGAISAQLVLKMQKQKHRLLGLLCNKNVVLSSMGIFICTFLIPFSIPIYRRSNLFKLAFYGSIPLIVHFSEAYRAKLTHLRWLLDTMKEYTTLCRRCMACLRDYKLVGNALSSDSSVAETMETLLVSQQMELALLLVRLTSTLLTNFPWLEEDISLTEIDGREIHSDLMKSHHAYLVLQSCFLKQLAQAHYPTKESHRVNHNERLHWLNTVLLPSLIDDVLQKKTHLHRVYRLLKTVFSNKGISQRPPSHGMEGGDGNLAQSGTTRAVVQLGAALKRAQRMDNLVDSCWSNKTDVDYNTLSKEFDLLSEDIHRCASDIETFKLKLRKLIREPEQEPETSLKQYEETIQNAVPVVNCDEAPVIRDEVFYCDQSLEDNMLNPKDDAVDFTTAPGANEYRASKNMLKELKRVLVSREDTMRQREQKALKETMPNLQHVPHFPRQLGHDQLEQPISDNESNDVESLVNGLQDSRRHYSDRKINLKTDTNSELKDCSPENKTPGSSGNQSPITSSSLSEEESTEVLQPSTSKIKNRVRRKKNHRSSKALVRVVDAVPIEESAIPTQDNADTVQDESLRPMEYRFGTGMALASMIQRAQNARPLLSEEVFDGEGEVEQDSGNDELSV